MRFFKLLLLSYTFSFFLSGCGLFLPAHSHSNFRDDEIVKVEFITMEDLCEKSEYKDIRTDYNAANPVPCDQKVKNDKENSQESVLGAALASAAIGFAVDFVQQKIEEESTLYEAQFEETILRQDFWDGEKQRYGAIRVTREVPNTFFEGTSTAFEFVLGLFPSHDNQLFIAIPLQFRTNYAKAKVLSDELWWWLLPTSWLGKILQHDEHRIDTNVAIEMVGYWRDKDQLLHTSTIAGFDINFNAYDLNKRELWRYSELGNFPKFPAGPKAFFAGAPKSIKGGNYVGNGSFITKVLVTERDRSNASKYLKELAKVVGEQKDQIITVINERISQPESTAKSSTQSKK